MLALGHASALQAQPAEAERWSFTATIGESHTDSVLLISPEDPGDTSDRVSVALAYGRLAERLSLTGSGYVSGTRYRRFQQFDRLDYGASFGLSYQPSRTASFVFGQTAGSGFYSPLLTDLRIQVPQVHVDILRSNALLTVRPAPRSTVKLDSEFGYLRFRSDLSTLDASEFPFGPLVLAGLVPANQAGLGLPELPTPVDSALVALGALAAEGVTRRRVDLVNYRVGTQLSHALARTTNASVQFGYRGLQYGSTALSSGGQFGADASLQQAFGLATSATLQYTYERNTAQVPTVSTQTARFQVERRWSPHFKTDLAFGVGLTGNAGATSSSGTSLLGSIGFTGNQKRTRYDAHYGRTMFQALGFGRNYLSDYASAYLDHAFTKRLSGRLDANYRHSQDVFARQFFFDASAYSASVRYRILRRTVVTLDYVLRRIDRGGGEPVIESSLWGFSLTYIRAFK